MLISAIEGRDFFPSGDSFIIGSETLRLDHIQCVAIRGVFDFLYFGADVIQEDAVAPVLGFLDDNPKDCLLVANQFRLSQFNPKLARDRVQELRQRFTPSNQQDNHFVFGPLTPQEDDVFGRCAVALNLHDIQLSVTEGGRAVGKPMCVFSSLDEEDEFGGLYAVAHCDAFKELSSTFDYNPLSKVSPQSVGEDYDLRAWGAFDYKDMN